MDILIEELNGSLWAAAVDKKGQLQGVEVDPAHEEVRWGSVYWAKVARIDAAQDAAFVNLDGENIGLIHNADVRIKQKDGSYKKGGDVAIGKVLHPGQMIAVQAKSAYLPADPNGDHPWLEDKNPRVSMNISLPGRYLIHLPLEHENRVSQRIRDKKLRAQMLSMLDAMGQCEGCILRAASANMQTDVLVREGKLLNAIWSQLQDYFSGEQPALIMEGPDAIHRLISDNAGQTIDRVEITVMDHYQIVEEWCELYAPDLVTKIVPVELPGAQTDMALFEEREITGQIEALFHPYALLPSGGTLIIQETAALTAIDVNRAGDDRPALAINLEAAQEIARQLRMRNMGGAVVIDFLKMKKKPEEDSLKKALEDAFNNDPCTVQVHGLTKLGLMEVTRQRRTPPLIDRVETEAV
ncbi:MAG: ribonuclease E/G [Rhodospirillales bacterium]|nr:ribonuclease E/G [Rhodospirillales bacterium]